MRKLVLISAVALGLLFAITGCEKDDDDRGTVIVKNETGFSAIVDVRWGDISENDQRTIGNGSETTYENVPAGDIVIWGKIDEEGYVWASYDAHLEANQTYTFTWQPPSD